jgi:hypothetical protein
VSIGFFCSELNRHKHHPHLPALVAENDAVSGDLEDRADAVRSATVGCAIQVSIGSQLEPGGGRGTVRAVEVVQRGQHAPSGDLETRAIAIGSASNR